MEQSQNNIPTETPALDFLTKFIGTGFFSGYVPKAPGTAGSVVGLAFMFLPGFRDPFTLIPVTLILFLMGGLAAEKMEKIYGQDPSIVTVDEIVGMWLSLWFIPFTYVNLVLAFVIFRALDILKPYPAVIFDQRTGGWNIMFDDIVAALYTNIIIQVALRINLF